MSLSSLRSSSLALSLLSLVSTPAPVRLLLIVLVSTTIFLKETTVKLTLVLRSGPAGLATALRPRGHSQHNTLRCAVCGARGGGGNSSSAQGSSSTQNSSSSRVLGAGVCRFDRALITRAACRNFRPLRAAERPNVRPACFMLSTRGLISARAR